MRQEIEELQAKKQKKKQEFEEQQNIYLAEKDEPMRIEKGNTNLAQAVKHLDVENADLEKTRNKYEHDTQVQQAEWVRHKEQMETNKEIKHNLDQHRGKLMTDLRNQETKIKELQ